MFPLLGWVGGIAAGAQVARGVVRGIAALIDGHPGEAIVHVADGLVAPVRTAWKELSRLRDDLVAAFFPGEPAEVGPVDHEFPRMRRGRAASTSVDGSADWLDMEPPIDECAEPRKPPFDSYAGTSHEEVVGPGMGFH
jgi:hypothetical protein